MNSVIKGTTYNVDSVITTRELAKMIRSAHICPDTLKDVKEVYEAYFGKPMSHTAHMLLHTEHKI